MNPAAKLERIPTASSPVLAYMNCCQPRHFEGSVAPLQADVVKVFVLS
jgi:hypothetical protein